VIVALGIFAALCAADARTAQRQILARAAGARVFAQAGGAGVIRAQIPVVAASVVDAGFLVATIIGGRAVFVRFAQRVVRRVTATAGKANIIGAFQTVVTVSRAATLAASAVAAALGPGALRRLGAGAVGGALIDRARISIVAVLRPPAPHTGIRHATGSTSAIPTRA